MPNEPWFSHSSSVLSTVVGRQGSDGTASTLHRSGRGRCGGGDRLTPIHLIRPRGQHLLDEREEDVALLLVEGVTPWHPQGKFLHHPLLGGDTRRGQHQVLH